MLLDEFGRPIPKRTEIKFVDRPSMRASGWDAIDTTLEMERHWENSDGKAPNASANAAVRRRYRNYARYEVRNNSYARGIVETLVNDCVGCGPRPQMLDSEETERNKEIERAWSVYAADVRFVEKCRVVRRAAIIDGEGCGLFVTNRRLSPVMLDVMLFEADQLADPQQDFFNNKLDQVDGVKLDRWGDPLRYYILDEHPGSNASMGTVFGPNRGRWRRAKDVIHYYREDRPGQRRGIPEIAPGLPLLAQLREYTLSVMGSARSAAHLGGVIESQATATRDPEGIPDLEPVPYERDMLLTMPFGWQMKQMRAEQPATTYAEFKREIINEFSRCLNLPINLASADSSKHNFASGRLDHAIYFRQVLTDRKKLEAVMLNRWFELWLQEYLGEISGILPSDIDLKQYQFAWVWDPLESADFKAFAQGIEILFNLGYIDDDTFVRKHLGQDPETFYESMARTVERRRAGDLPIPGLQRQEVEVDEESGERVVSQ
jgi:capsid protein